MKRAIRNLFSVAVIAILSPGAANADGAALRGFFSGIEAVPTPANIFSNVSVYRRSGSVEVYGATLSETKSGPVSISTTVLTFDGSSPYASVFWRPSKAFSVRADRLGVLMGFAEVARRSTLVVKTCGAIAFSAYGAALDAESLDLHVRRHDLRPVTAEWLTGHTVQASAGGLQETPSGWVAAVSATDQTDGVACIEAIGLVVPVNETTTFTTIGWAGLVAASDEQRQWTGRIAGELAASVALRFETETGTGPLTLAPEPTGRFVVPDIDPFEPVKLTATHLGEAFWPAQGRWSVGLPGQDFVVEVGRDPADVRVMINPDRNIFPSRRTTSPYAAIYREHSAMFYAGFAGIQEFENPLFTNNFGWHDQDRIFLNPNDCLRILVAGSSTFDAIQVPVSQHFTTLLEEELGRAIDRCVEAIAASDSNLDPGGAFDHFVKYGSKFEPDFVVFEAGPELFLQMNDIYAWNYLGWSVEEPVKGRFKKAQNGGFTYVEKSPRWVAALNPEPSKEGLPGDVEREDIYFTRFSAMPDEFLSVFDVLDEIKGRIETPRKTQLILASYVHQLGCRESCKRWTAQMPAGDEEAGFQKWLEEFRNLCERRSWNCVAPPVPGGFGQAGNYLSFDFDAHPSSAGHQWMAATLAVSIASLLNTGEN